MKHRLRRRLISISGIILGFLALTAVLGQTAQPARAHGITTITTKYSSTGTVTALVLDMSGSMAQNDPPGLRCSAANAFIDLSGPGNYIGVIGLDNSSGDRGGKQNFQLAQEWAQPTEMATLAERQQLKKVIAAQSNHCRPDYDTPTYDALTKALQMLSSATNNGQIPGSVVLLTDGVPDPDTIAQMNAIQTALLPQFKQHRWPIDTVALGTDGSIPGTNTTFHQFLSGLSDATSGKFYDDGHGKVPGISSLNIADFFVDIFARQNHRTVQNDIPPTTLNGGTTRRNFSVTDYTNNLDVVVVKDQASTRATLITPGGQPISQSGGGVFVSASDPHYEIFSIDRPQSGQWELDVTGSGQFLMDSLKVSGIGLSSISVSQANLAASATPALALGQPLTISANLTYNGQSITDNRFTLNGTITYSGALGQFNRPFTLDDKSSPGTFTGKVTVPGNAPPGSYEIDISASSVSFESVVASQNRSIRIELFPLPVLDASQGTAIQWDPGLRTIYSLPFWPFPQLSHWALSGIPAQTDADITGGVQLRQQPYQDASVSATASNLATHVTVPAAVVNDGNGRFHILFTPPGSGAYLLTFKTSGTFQDSHGDFGTSQASTQITIVPATLNQELHAWGFTTLYLLCLLLLYRLLCWMLTAHPRGAWQRYHQYDVIESGDFRRSTRGLWQGFMHRNLLHSRQAKWERGLLLRFRYGGGVEVRADGAEGRKWELSDGSDIPHDFREVSEVRYRPDRAFDNQLVAPAANGNRPGSSNNSDIDESSSYVFSGRAKVRNKVGGYEDEDEDYEYAHRNNRRARKKKKVNSYDEDEE